MRRGPMLLTVFTFLTMLSGCASQQEQPQLSRQETGAAIQNAQETEAALRNETEITAEPKEEEMIFIEAIPDITESAAVSPTTTLRPDWSSYFDGLNGAAVIFDPREPVFQVYNENLADTRHSPCSTFKIISSLAGLERGAINQENSSRPWSGEGFWNDDWTRAMDFPTAFRTSCVWYYRQVIDDIGPEIMEETLNELQYGNCDVSDWEGHLNNNNSNPALTGFWLESSLKISPREQTEVLERIFGSSSRYSQDVQALLEEVMFLPESSDETCRIYGKTGMGKSGGIVVDCWYTGFADMDHRIYFCIYLGATPGQNVSSARAREIAVSLIKENYSQSGSGEDK